MYLIFVSSLRAANLPALFSRRALRSGTIRYSSGSPRKQGVQHTLRGALATGGEHTSEIVSCVGFLVFDF